MILIGEKLNSSIPKTLEAFQARDEAAVDRLITRQAQAGAHYLDINTALCGEAELDTLLWVMKLVLSDSACGLMLDSPNPQVLAAALGEAGDRPVILNSVTLSQRLEELAPLAAETGAGVVALPILGGTPETAQERVDLAARLLDALHGFGVQDSQIYLDILVESLGLAPEHAPVTLETLTLCKAAFPRVKTICGLSNISFGLPRRQLINTAFLASAITRGLDSAILDVTTEAIRDTCMAASAISGEDEYAMDYIRYIRRKG